VPGPVPRSGAGPQPRPERLPGAKVAMGRERALPPLTTLTQQVAAVVLFPFVKNNRDPRRNPPQRPGLSPGSCPPRHDGGRSRADGAASSGQDAAPCRHGAKAIATAGRGAVGREDLGASGGTGSAAGVSALPSGTERRLQLRGRCRRGSARPSASPCPAAATQLAGDFRCGGFLFFFFPFFFLFFNKNGL